MIVHGMLSLACKDAGFDCAHVMTANTEDELMKRAGEHAQSVHNLNPQDMSPEMVSKIKSVIKTQ
jgi:predicted small metal-binding protein